MLSRLGFSTKSIHTVVLYRGTKSQASGVGCVAKILVWDYASHYDSLRSNRSLILCATL